MEETIRLYHYLHDRLKYMRPSVAALIGAANASGEFESLGFLAACEARMQGGSPFGESWRCSVGGSIPELGEASAQVVMGLGGVLGASDLESQLSAIEYSISVLDSRLEEARELAAVRMKLYGTLGLLAGLGAAILVA